MAQDARISVIKEELDYIYDNISCEVEDNKTACKGKCVCNIQTDLDINERKSPLFRTALIARKS